jgi:sec-independent protein translocase protein TatA
MLDLLELPALAFIFGSPGVGEILVIGMIAVVLFGKRLPEVARSVGKSYNQFRRGLSDIQSDFNSQVYSEVNSTDYSSYDVPQITNDQEQDVPTAPRFEPPTSEPTAADSWDSDVTVSDSSGSDVTVSDSPGSDVTVSDSPGSDVTVSDSPGSDTSLSDPEGPADSEP